LIVICHDSQSNALAYSKKHSTNVYFIVKVTYNLIYEVVQQFICLETFPKSKLLFWKNIALVKEIIYSVLHNFLKYFREYYP